MSPRSSSAAAQAAQQAAHLTEAVRSRVPRLAEAAVERARLTVVPPRAVGRTQAARTPFAVLVIALLVAGVVGLLMFNTQMQQTSFTATALQQRADTLTAKKQSLSLELDALRQPQRVAEAAQDLGMVAPAQPAFVRLADGTILGEPAPATGKDTLQVKPAPVEKPEELRRKVERVVVDPVTGQTVPAPDAAAAGGGPGGPASADDAG